MKFQLALLVVGLACQVLAAPTSDTSILKTLQSKKSATVIVSVAGSKVAELRKQFKTQSFSTRAEKLNSFHSLLKSHADATQVNILALLNELKAEHPIVVEQLWISNKIIVKNADLTVVEKLLAMEEVAGVREEKIILLEEPRDLIVHPDGTVPQAGEQWGVLNVQAPEAWAAGVDGTGAVIGLTDTGARVTHVALKDGHRAEKGWFDPYRGTATPNDQNGHGTHTAGSVAGRANGIGVAPGAQWIACKGCSTSSCTEAALSGCGQWMACPTDADGSNEDCSLAPNAVSNSWGGGQGDDWYDDIMSAWAAVDVAPIFAIGNEGPSCGSASSPGDSEVAIAVGSITSANGLSSFSSVGPTYRGARIKPDVAAPGTSVVSSYYLSDTSYSTLSGTSMATPHVAGLAALLYSADDSLSVDELRAALVAGAQPISKTTGTCGGIPATTYPNNYVGQGKVNAPASLKAVKAMRQ